jgi:dihydroflavonol-4-reductase
MRLLITGATGFVGNVLLDLLPGAVTWTRLSVLVTPGDTGVARIRTKRLDGLGFIEGDVTDPASVAAAVRGHTHIIHLAGLISYRRGDRARMESVNRDGARNVAEAAAREGVARLIHVSSVGAVGFRRDGAAADESTPFNWPESISYMATKRAGQDAVEEVMRRDGLRAVILNPGSLLGPGDPDPLSDHNRLYAAVARGPLFGCFAGGLAFADVRDLAAIVLEALTRGEEGQSYLVVGANATYAEVVRTIGRWFGRPVFPFRVPPLLLTAAGSVMEAAAAVAGRRPFLTAAQGRLGGCRAWYDNAKGAAAFRHAYRPFAETIADGCAYWAATHGPRKGGDTSPAIG